MPIMALIKELHQNDMELADHWRERSNFWFDRHKEKDMMFWNEREKRMKAEKELVKFQEVVVNDASKIKVGKTIVIGNEAMKVVAKEGNTLIVKEMGGG